MKTDSKTFLLSLSLHLAVIGSAVSFAEVPLLQDKPVVIDFTIESGQDKKDAGSRPEAATAPLKAAAETATARPVQNTPQAQHKPDPSPVATETSPDAAPISVPSFSALPKSVPAMSGPPAVSGMIAKSQLGTGIGKAGTPDSSGSGSAAKPDNAEALRMMYLKKHFAYIRDQVAGNMRYPGLAGRMGWSGRLAVEFVVQKDGSANSIRIVKSSGVSLLDSDARDTVLRSAPFPKPPVSAKLVIPIEYSLEK